jgi:hypothetical protein
MKSLECIDFGKISFLKLETNISNQKMTTVKLLSRNNNVAILYDDIKLAKGVNDVISTPLI